MLLILQPADYVAIDRSRIEAGLIILGPDYANAGLEEDDLWERVTRRLNEFKDFYETGLKEGKQMIFRNHADYSGV